MILQVLSRWFVFDGLDSTDPMEPIISIKPHHLGWYLDGFVSQASNKQIQVFGAKNSNTWGWFFPQLGGETSKNKSKVHPETWGN